MHNARTVLAIDIVRVFMQNMVSTFTSTGIDVIPIRVIRGTKRKGTLIETTAGRAQKKEQCQRVEISRDNAQ